jgi:2,3-bisphosphoglycerate-dependent phosphoglycerate mutase
VHGAFREATLSPIPFWFLRHGETDWNAQGISQGNVDIPLNPTGLAQARAAAQKLKGRGIATIMASPLSRAKVTADYVGEALGLPVAIDHDLREVGFGVQEGQPMSNWFTDWISGTFTPEGAEPFAALRARAVAAANRATAQPPAVLLVAHGALFRSLRAAMGIEPVMRTQNAVPIFCEPPRGGEMAWTLTPMP